MPSQAGGIPVMQILMYAVRTMALKSELYMNSVQPPAVRGSSVWSSVGAASELVPKNMFVSFG